MTNASSVRIAGTLIAIWDIAVIREVERNITSPDQSKHKIHKTQFNYVFEHPITVVNVNSTF